MAYQLRYDKHFRQSLQSLPSAIRSLARKSIANLAQEPRPIRAKELDNHPTYYRLWLSKNYRLIWQVIEEDKIVDLIYVGPKVLGLYDQLRFQRNGH